MSIACDLCVLSCVLKIIKERKKKENKTYNITGMKYQGCVNTVTEKLSVKGVDKVQVDLEKTNKSPEGNHGVVTQTCPLKGISLNGDKI